MPTIAFHEPVTLPDGSTEPGMSVPDALFSRVLARVGGDRELAAAAFNAYADPQGYGQAAWPRSVLGAVREIGRFLQGGAQPPAQQQPAPQPAPATPRPPAPDVTPPGMGIFGQPTGAQKQAQKGGMALQGGGLPFSSRLFG